MIVHVIIGIVATIVGAVVGLLGVMWVHETFVRGREGERFVVESCLFACCMAWLATCMFGLPLAALYAAGVPL